MFFRAPAGLLHVRALRALLMQCRNPGVQIVAHEVEFVRAVLLGGMKGRFRRRHRKDQPSVPGIYAGKSEDVPEKCAIGFRVLAIKNYVRAKDHEVWPLLNDLRISRETAV